MTDLDHAAALAAYEAATKRPYALKLAEQADEIERLKAENRRLREAIVKAATAIELLVVKRQRIAASSFGSPHGEVNPDSGATPQ